MRKRKTQKLGNCKANAGEDIMSDQAGRIEALTSENARLRKFIDEQVAEGERDRAKIYRLEHEAYKERGKALNLELRLAKLRLKIREILDADANAHNDQEKAGG